MELTGDRSSLSWTILRSWTDNNYTAWFNAMRIIQGRRERLLSWTFTIPMNLDSQDHGPWLCRLAKPSIMKLAWNASITALITFPSMNEYNANRSGGEQSREMAICWKYKRVTFWTSFQTLQVTRYTWIMVGFILDAE